uniref:cupin domain-containing protein n=1 Tax=Thermogemmatispora onikobensis TaxID=732234 RepID=UPI000852D936
TAGRQLLLALQEGQRQGEHRTSYHAFIQVISGHLIFTLEHERISMRAGTLLHLEPRVAHSVEALQDSVFLITMIGAGAPPESEAAEPASEPQRVSEGGEG